MFSRHLRLSVYGPNDGKAFFGSLRPRWERTARESKSQSDCRPDDYV